MDSSKYWIEFLPIAKQDMTDIARYISQELFNPTEAIELADEMIENADRLRDFPYINSIHQTIKPLNHEYRKLVVKNYIMFYWIDEDQKSVTIARVLYAKRDYEELL